MRFNARLGCAVLCMGLGLAGLAWPVTPSLAQEKTPKPLTKEEAAKLQDQASYIIGYNLGMNMKNQMVEVTPEEIFKGLKDGLSSKESPIKIEDMPKIIDKFRAETTQKQQAKFKAMGEENLKEGKAFLEANKKKKGVKTTPSGLQYRVIRAGKGESPKPNDQVEVNYRGSFTDGKEFDSSLRRGKPVTVSLANVIKGWREILPMMKTGGLWEVVVPADLAYGERGMFPRIGPNAVLVFQIEVIKVLGPEPPSPQGGGMMRPPHPPVSGMKPGEKMERVTPKEAPKSETK
ncbi:MAG: FKBP-type peptidyl-prolyl cis-trans isomerase [Deltaproteobacteria bacterium]|nr:FKBP-type peptidyl-prolyl cis-trans isomerase [Deltaproteobacteria bacterium]